MGTFYNASEHTRFWPALRNSAGRTLELAPGEEAELDLPADFEDAYLKARPVEAEPVSRSPKQRKDAPEPGDVPAASEPPVSEE